MFSAKPILYLKYSKEIKKIFSLFHDFQQDIKKEMKTKIFNSYNALVITKDNKLLLCNRTLSFYASYLIVMLSTEHKFVNLNYHKIKNCLYNVNINEFLTFYYILDQYKIINLKKYLSESVYNNFIYLILPKYLNQFNNIKYNKIKLDLILIQLLNNILIDFNSNNFILSDNKYIILPGGKQKTLYENPIKILKRELLEELNISTEDIEYLDKYYKFQSFNKNPHPVLVMYIYDKILKHIYLDLTFILKINKTFNEIYKNFKINNEINNLIGTSQINFNTQNLQLSNIIYLLKIYKKFI